MDAVEVLAMLRGSGIPWKTLEPCAALVYEWERGNEPDARLFVVKIAKVLQGAFEAKNG
jgi:hypothetical protein